MEDLCCAGCLAAGRKMQTIDNIWMKQCFLQIINEIPMTYPEQTPLWLCWVCRAQVRRFTGFKVQVQSSYKTLNGYAKEHNNLMPTYQSQILKVHNIHNISLTQDFTQQDEVFIKTVKTENDHQNHTPEFDVKDELEEDISRHSDKLNSDLDDDVVLAKLDKNKRSTKKGKAVAKRKIKRKTKKDNGKTKESADNNQGGLCVSETDRFIEVEYSNEEIMKEREELRLKDEFVNAVFKCERCIVPFPNPDDLKDHIALKHELNSDKFVCAVCERCFSNDVSYKYHVDKHSRRFRCAVCHVHWDSRSKAVRHHETYHSGEAAYQCQVCQDGFDNQKAYKQHLASHETHTAQPARPPGSGPGAEPDSQPDSQPEKVYGCELCEKRFRWKTSLRKHTETHRIASGQKRMPYCDTCRLSFKTTSNLQKHVKTSSKHQILLKVIKAADGDPDGAETEPSLAQIRRSVRHQLSQHRCTQCDRRFQFKGNLRRHQKTHQARARGELVCVPCARSFSSIATYNQHMQASRRHVSETDFKHACAECGRRFANKTRLRDHVDWEHLKVYTHTCEHCKKVFKSHTSLYLHKQVVHRKDSAEHLCDHCGKPFPNRTKLRAHIVALHSDESPYCCPVCRARFNWHSCLSRHMRALHKQQQRP